MSETEQRIQIAKLCGYRAWQRAKIYSHGIEYEWSRRNPDNQRINGFELSEHESLCDPKALPNYLYDLNACHQMEKVLWTRNDWSACEYEKRLNEVTTSWPWHATAAQRCEAFLQVVKAKTQTEETLK